MIILPGLRQLISFSSDDGTFDFFIPEDAVAVVLPEDEHVFHHGHEQIHFCCFWRLTNLICFLPGTGICKLVVHLCSTFSTSHSQVSF